MAGLDTPDTGEIIVDDEHLEQKSEEDLADMRNKKIGFIFQSFELIESFTALENTRLPLALRNNTDSIPAENILKEVGLAERGHHFPSQLSGGEKQRVAIARALIHTPDIIFADEPTGNLDEETSEKIFDLLLEVVEKNNTTLVLITHNRSIAERMDTRYLLKDGQLHQQK